jgi:hypothetical protein
VYTADETGYSYPSAVFQFGGNGASSSGVFEFEPPHRSSAIVQTTGVPLVPVGPTLQCETRTHLVLHSPDAAPVEWLLRSASDGFRYYYAKGSRNSVAVQSSNIIAYVDFDPTADITWI